MKNIVWILGVIVLFFVGDRVMGYVLSNQVQQSQFRYSRMYNANADVDMLLVGNSRGLMFYQPYIEEATGMSTLNLSYNGMPSDLMNILVQDHITINGAPKEMIVDVTLCDRIDHAMSAGFNLYTPYSEKLSNHLKDKSKNTYYGGELSHLFRYNSEIFQRAMFYRNKSDEDWLLDRQISQNMIDGAADLDTFWIHHFRPEMDSLNKVERITQRVSSWFSSSDTEEFGVQKDSLYQIDKLTEMVTFAQSKGTNVNLVINPYYPPFVKSIINKESFKALVEEKTGLPVRDYATAITTPTAFGDYQHLNKSGSMEYLDILLRDLGYTKD